MISAEPSADDEGTGVAGSNYRGLAVRKGDRGPNLLHMFFFFLGSIIICQLYTLTLTDQAQVTLQLRVSLSDLI
jgi:hypothetical protein